jgi:hypothetical protein
MGFPFFRVMKLGKSQTSANYFTKLPNLLVHGRKLFQACSSKLEFFFVFFFFKNNNNTKNSKIKPKPEGPRRSTIFQSKFNVIISNYINKVTHL